MKAIGTLISKYSVPIVATAILGAWVIPGTPVGLGVSVVALAAILSAVAIAGGLPNRVTTLYLVLGTALAGIATVRTAGWLIALDLFAALILFSIATVPSRRWKVIATAPLFLITLLPAALRDRIHQLNLRSISTLKKFQPVARGLFIGAGLLTVFGILFITGDDVFRSFVSKALTPDWDLGLLPLRTALFALLVAFVSTVAFSLKVLRSNGSSDPDFSAQAELFNPKETDRPKRKLGSTEWTVALTLLNVLFGLFVLVQLTALFGGNGYVLETAGVTYSQYARSGFGQLVVAAFFTVAVIAGANQWAGFETRSQERRLRGLLGLLCLFTLVILASALKRIDLVEDAFGLTHVRLNGHVMTVWIGGIIALLLAARLRLSVSWLPITVVGYTAAVLITFSLLNPDGLITRYNIDRFDRTGKLDLTYLESLSADAVPDLAGLPPELRQCALSSFEGKVSPTTSWASANVDRARALRTLEDTAPVTGTTERLCNRFRE